MAALVFISYASGDHDRARVVRDDLEADGIPCWMASRDILGSDDYVTAIPPAIEHARVVLLVLSAAALASEHVFREVHLATDDKKPILPVRVEPITAVEGLLEVPARRKAVGRRHAPRRARARQDPGGGTKALSLPRAWSSRRAAARASSGCWRPPARGPLSSFSRC